MKQRKQGNKEVPTWNVSVVINYALDEWKQGLASWMCT